MVGFSIIKNFLLVLLAILIYLGLMYGVWSALSLFLHEGVSAFAVTIAAAFNVGHTFRAWHNLDE